MKRTEKYPDTSTFHFHNANPRGRLTADCWARAISTGLDIAYDTVVMEMAQIHIETGYAIACDKSIDIYLERKGWVKHKQPRRTNGTKYTGEQFCRATKVHSPIIANMGGHHITAIIKGKVNDIWDCTDRCIGNYWTKGETK